jgi:hypothetical protein
VPGARSAALATATSRSCRPAPSGGRTPQGLALAQLRGDYGTADGHRAFLAIFVETGDRAGIARTLSQFGVLRTDQGRPARRHQLPG